MKKRKRKIFSKILIFILVLVITAGAGALGINWYVKSSVWDRIITVEDAAEQTKADCIIVLGCGIWDGKPSPMLRDRLLTGIELYNAGAADKIIMSGDHGSEDYDEVNVMKSFAVERGVPSEDVFMDHAGFSTYESIYRARDIFEADSVIIVTQEYHLYRALYIADKLSVTAVGVSSDLDSYSGQSMRELREMLARVKDFFNCIIKPEPTYLGEAIPVSGNGDVTNDKNA